jgi:hypothetical protein
MQRELSLLVGVKGQFVPIFHFAQLQLKLRRRPLPGVMIPPVCQQDTADIQEQRRNLS